MTFSLRRKRRTTRPARSTPRRRACSLLAAAAGLALAGSAAAQDGEARSAFRPRTDGPPAVLVLPVQAKSANPTVPPGSTPGTTPPGTGTGAQPGRGTIPPGGTPVPSKGPGTIPGTGIPIPGVPGPAPGAPPGAAPGDVGLPGARSGQDPYEAYIRLEPPGREKLFGSRDTERELEERMRQERRDSTGTGESIQFPEKPKLTDVAYGPRKFAPMVEVAEPNYVVYRRLYFEEVNSERYGWDLGPAQLAVSTLAFFKDTLLFPHNFASYPCRRFDTSAGHCQPGDPVPYILYPPEFTGTGLLAEVGAVALLFWAIP